MTLLHPWVLLLLPLPWLCHRLCGRLLSATLFSDPELLKRSVAHRHFSSRSMRLLIYTLILLALADPVTRHGVTVVDQPAYRIALLLDDSRSMEEGERFTRAKEAMKRFIRSRSGDALALGIFADYAAVASPLTREHAGLLTILDTLRTAMAGGRETALYEALWRGAELLGDGKGERGFIVLITDGIDTVGSIPLPVVLKRLKEKRIRVYTIGVGDDYRREVLERIAAETGGTFHSAGDPDALPKILERIDRMEKSPLHERKQLRYTHYDRWLLAATLFLALALLWRNRREPAEALRTFALLLLLGAAWSRAATGPDRLLPEPRTPPLYMALDLSRSMEAGDCAPSRLKQAIHDAKVLLQLLPPRLPVALLGYARQPYLIAPPTPDHQRLLFLLDHLDPSSIDRDGSDLSALIGYLSRREADTDRGRKPAALILGDGGEAQQYAAAEAEAKRYGLRLYGIGTATERGAPIPTPRGLLKDAKGHLVLSRLNPAFVSLVESSGGTLLHCPATKRELESFADTIAAYLGADAKEPSRDDGTRRTLLWLAVLLIFLPIPYRRRKK